MTLCSYPLFSTHVWNFQFLIFHVTLSGFFFNFNDLKVGIVLIMFQLFMSFYYFFKNSMWYVWFISHSSLQLFLLDAPKLLPPSQFVYSENRKQLQSLICAAHIFIGGGSIVDTPLRKTYFPSPRSHQLSIIPHLVVRVMSFSLFQARMLTGLIWVGFEHAVTTPVISCIQ